MGARVGHFELPRNAWSIASYYLGDSYLKQEMDHVLRKDLVLTACCGLCVTIIVMIGWQPKSACKVGARLGQSTEI